jgi:hypothetical protein
LISDKKILVESKVVLKGITIYYTLCSLWRKNNWILGR